MTCVVDASALVDLLLRSEAGDRVRRWLLGASPVMVSVAHVDAEVFSALARLQRDGVLDTTEVEPALRHLADAPIDRLPITGELLAAAWGLRANVAARDALYVAAARGLDACLLTTDGALARACGDVAVELG